MSLKYINLSMTAEHQISKVILSRIESVAVDTSTDLLKCKTNNKTQRAMDTKQKKHRLRAMLWCTHDTTWTRQQQKFDTEVLNH